VISGKAPCCSHHVSRLGAHGLHVVAADDVFQSMARFVLCIVRDADVDDVPEPTARTLQN
jgi:hypothetical protein